MCQHLHTTALLFLFLVVEAYDLSMTYFGGFFPHRASGTVFTAIDVATGQEVNGN